MRKLYFSTLFLGSVVLLVSHNVSGVSVEKYLTLTASQKTALDKFRQKVEPMLYANYMKHDTYLIQWIRARNFDINSAEQMLRENLKWRKNNGIDNMRKEDWSDLVHELPLWLGTYDKTGRPIGVFEINLWDIRGTILQGRGPRGLRYVMNLVENLTGQVYERQEKFGMNVTQIVIIANAEGFNVIQHGCPACLPFWIQFVQLIESHYPEALDEFIIINATPAIQVVLEAVKPFLSKNNRDGIKVFGPNKAKWLPYLDAKISKEERTEKYGGTKPPPNY